ncbi:13228_t:CDS:2, partial [Acaulospora morrowiae]
DTTGMIEKVRATIYLSLDELWSVPTDNALIATFLDPRFKHFNWTTNGERDKTQQLVKALYDTLKEKLRDCMQINIEDNDEILYYIKLSNIRVKDDPLIWW